MESDPAFDDRWLGAFIPADHWHFHRRLYERYKIVLGPGEYSKLLSDLENGRSQMVQPRRGGSAIVAVKIQKQRVYLIAKGRYVMTVMPRNAALNRKRRALLEGINP